LSIAKIWKEKPRNISIVNDTEGWCTKWCKVLEKEIIKAGDKCKLYFNYKDMPADGDIAFYLGCTRLASANILSKNLLNIVVHASDLPQGRGFSPLKWQILEGANIITVSILEAGKLADAGKIFIKDKIIFEGHELLDEMQNILGKKCNSMCLNFLSQVNLALGKTQIGSPTYYNKRNIKDQRIDPYESIYSQFNKLRVADNIRFPAFFNINGIDYEIKIKKK
jgi:methionyl-tRNA formyltransferase